VPRACLPIIPHDIVCLHHMTATRSHGFRFRPRRRALQPGLKARLLVADAGASAPGLSDLNL
jgi:hypothetical protein